MNAVTITVRPIPVVAEIATIDGTEFRLNIAGGKTRFAVVTEAGEQIAIQAVFETKEAAVEAAQALEQLVRGSEGPKLATRDGETLQ